MHIGLYVTLPSPVYCPMQFICRILSCKWKVMKTSQNIALVPPFVAVAADAVVYEGPEPDPFEDNITPSPASWR